MVFPSCRKKLSTFIFLTKMYIVLILQISEKNELEKMLKIGKDLILNPLTEKGEFPDFIALLSFSFFQVFTKRHTYFNLTSRFPLQNPYSHWRYWTMVNMQLLFVQKKELQKLSHYF